MKVKLIDMDSHNMPNLALLKLSAYKGRWHEDVHEIEAEIRTLEK